MSSRIGVDIGGTFTDFIVYDENDNKVIIDKIPIHVFLFSMLNTIIPHLSGAK